jgi:hypothetical protein
VRLDFSPSESSHTFGRRAQFLKNGALRWSLLNDVLGDDTQNIGFKDWVSGDIPFVIQNPYIGIHTANPTSDLDVRGLVQVMEGPTTPDTKVYATFGVTRDPSNGNNSYIGMTKSGHVAWTMGINTGDELIIGPASGSPERTMPSPIVRVHPWNRSVVIEGSLTATGTKCREVRETPYGSLFFNAVESGHAIFSDDGENQLRDGACHVSLDPRWLAGATIDERHPMRVWITFTGESGGAYYVKKGLTGFDVIGVRGSEATFDWKVEARQKGYEDLYLDHSESIGRK